MLSKVGVKVVDAHAHFMTYGTVRNWLNGGTSLDRLEQRAKSKTDMKNFELPKKEEESSKRFYARQD